MDFDCYSPFSEPAQLTTTRCHFQQAVLFMALRIFFQDI